MAELDRSTFIALLNRLGAADDAEVLAAARELHATIIENGVTWDSLLVPDSAPEEIEDEEEDEDDEIDAEDEDEEEEDEEEEEDDEAGDESDEDEEADDEDDGEAEDGEDDDETSEEDDAAVAESEQPAAEAGAATSTGAGAADAAEDKRLLERLLARKGLSQETREDLAEFQRDLDRGKLAAMDRRYIRALAKRMGL